MGYINEKGAFDADQMVKDAWAWATKGVGGRQASAFEKPNAWLGTNPTQYNNDKFENARANINPGGYNNDQFENARVQKPTVEIRDLPRPPSATNNSLSPGGDNALPNYGRGGLTVSGPGDSQSYIDSMNRATDIYRQINAENGTGLPASGASSYVSDAIKQLLGQNDQVKVVGEDGGYGLLDRSPQGQLERMYNSTDWRFGSPQNRARMAKAMEPFTDQLKNQGQNQAQMLNSLANLQGNMYSADQRGDYQNQLLGLRESQLAQNQNQFDQKQQLAQLIAQSQNQYRTDQTRLGQERNDLSQSKAEGLPAALLPEIGKLYADPSVADPDSAAKRLVDFYRQNSGQGLPQAPAAQQNLPRVSSEADIQKLPKGSKFIMPDGTIGQI